MFVARKTKRGWRVFLEPIDAPAMDLFGAISEAVARETAAQMNAYRQVQP